MSTASEHTYASVRTRRTLHHGMSMREKSLYKREVNAHHRSNFAAGRREADARALTRTGLRGRKAVLVTVGIVLALCIAAAELAWTCVILSTLQMDTNGIPALQFLSDGALRISKPAHMIVAIIGQYVGAFQDMPLTISAREVSENSTVRLTADYGTLRTGRQKSEVVLSTNGIAMVVGSAFSLTTETLSADGTHLNNTFFLVNRSHLIMPVPDRASSLASRLLQTPKVSSLPGKELTISASSGQTLNFDGLEGMDVGGRQVNLQSTQTAVNTPLFKAQAQRLTIDMQQWPITFNSSSSSSQFIICACRSSSLDTILFRVPASPQRCQLPVSTQLPDGC